VRQAHGANRGADREEAVAGIIDLPTVRSAGQQEGTTKGMSWQTFDTLVAGGVNA
jgi:hypothetical protein